MYNSMDSVFFHIVAPFNSTYQQFIRLKAIKNHAVLVKLFKSLSMEYDKKVRPSWTWIHFVIIYKAIQKVFWIAVHTKNKEQINKLM